MYATELTTQISECFKHSVFMYFVQCLQQTVVVSPYIRRMILGRDADFIVA